MTNHRQVERVALTLIAVFMLPVALQAAFTPRSFFDDFPLGRGWISHQGDAYNEHLVRDVGGLFLAMVIVTAWVAWRRLSARPIAVAWLVQGLLHVVFHARHLDGFGTGDQVALIGSLAAVPVLSLLALWANFVAANQVDSAGATKSGG